MNNKIIIHMKNEKKRKEDKLTCNLAPWNYFVYSSEPVLFIIEKLIIVEK